MFLLGFGGGEGGVWGIAPCTEGEGGQGGQVDCLDGTPATVPYAVKLATSQSCNTGRHSTTRFIAMLYMGLH